MASVAVVLVVVAVVVAAVVKITCGGGMVLDCTKRGYNQEKCFGISVNLENEL